MTTYFVRPVNGSDAAAGTSFATAWQTTANVDTNRVAGSKDEIRLCAEATEDITSAILWTKSGSTDQRLVITGASGVDGSDDGSIYTIRATAAMAYVMGFNDGATRYYLKNLCIDANNNATNAIDDPQNYTEDWGPVFYVTEFKNAIEDGINWAGGDRKNSIQLTDCDVHSHGRDGINSNNMTLLGTLVHDNIRDGVRHGSGQMACVGCEINGNGAVGYNDQGGGGFHLDRATIFGNGSHAVFVSNQGDGTITNTTMTENGGFAVIVGTLMVAMSFNHHYNNTSGPTNYAGAGPVSNGLPGFFNAVATDPLFTSTVDGSEDFAPLTGSPLIAAGLLDNTIGARETLAAAITTPSVDDVRLSVIFGPGDTLIGTVRLPTNPQVVKNVVYDANDSETGSFTCPTSPSSGIVARKLKQKAVYWEPDALDDYGQLSYLTGVEKDVRWQDVQQLFIDSLGQERTSRAIAYFDSTEEDWRINGRLYLGTLASLSGVEQADPTLVDNAWVIEQLQDSPNLRSATTLGKVFM